MTFTPGSVDPERTDTIEAQTTPDRDIDKKVKEEFEQAQSGVKTIAEGLYNFAKGTLFLTTGGSVQATQALDAVRAKIEGKPFTPPSPNPNAPGIINLEQITTEEAFTRPNVQEELPPVTDGPTSSLLDLYGGSVSPEIKEILSGITARMKGGTDRISTEPKGVILKPNNPEDYKNQAMFDALTDVSQYDRNTGERLETFGETAIEKGARGFREEAAEQLEKGSTANVTPQMQATLTGSLTDIPGYKNVVGSAAYYDYNVIRQLIAGGRVAKDLGLQPRGVSARDFLEAFQTPVTLGGASRGIDFGQYRNLNVPKLKATFGPALEALGLPRNAAQIHHIAALHGISGIFHKLGYNSPIYREVVDTILTELPDFAKGMGSMSGNLMPIIAGSADSPHYYAHLFYTDVIGKDGSKFFTPQVLEGMVKSKSFRLSKAKELGQIIAQSERIASQAQNVYEKLYAQGTSIGFDEIMDVMMELNSQGKLDPDIMSPRYQVKAVGNLIKNINLALEVEQLNPSLDAMLVLQTKSRPNLNVLRNIIAGGGTGGDAQKALNKLYGKPLKGGDKQIDFFEDIIDVENFLDKYRVESRNKRQAAKERKNQAKYFADQDTTK